MVHENFSYTRMVMVAGYNSSAEMADDSRHMRRTLYPGSIKALLHSTACAVTKQIVIEVQTTKAATAIYYYLNTM